VVLLFIRGYCTKGGSFFNFFFFPPPHFVSLIILALLNKTNDNVIN